MDPTAYGAAPPPAFLAAIPVEPATRAEASEPRHPLSSSPSPTLSPMLPTTADGVSALTFPRPCLSLSSSPGPTLSTMLPRTAEGVSALTLPWPCRSLPPTPGPTLSLMLPRTAEGSPPVLPRTAEVASARPLPWFCRPLSSSPGPSLSTILPRTAEGTSATPLPCVCRPVSSIPGPSRSTILPTTAEGAPGLAEGAPALNVAADPVPLILCLNTPVPCLCFDAPAPAPRGISGGSGCGMPVVPSGTSPRFFCVALEPPSGMRGSGWGVPVVRFLGLRRFASMAVLRAVVGVGAGVSEEGEVATALEGAATGAGPCDRCLATGKGTTEGQGARTPPPHPPSPPLTP